MNKVFDLRFVIGSFFFLIGLMLTIYHFSAEAATDVNLWCGLGFIAFGLLMILLSFRKDADDELIEDVHFQKTNS